MRLLSQTMCTLISHVVKTSIGLLGLPPNRLGVLTRKRKERIKGRKD